MKGHTTKKYLSLILFASFYLISNLYKEFYLYKSTGDKNKTLFFLNNGFCHIEAKETTFFLY